jgi:hypothetical protein
MTIPNPSIERQATLHALPFMTNVIRLNRVELDAIASALANYYYADRTSANFKK